MLGLAVAGYLVNKSEKTVRRIREVYEEGVGDGWEQGYREGYADSESGLDCNPDAASRRYGLFIKEKYCWPSNFAGRRT